MVGDDLERLIVFNAVPKDLYLLCISDKHSLHVKFESPSVPFGPPLRKVDEFVSKLRPCLEQRRDGTPHDYFHLKGRVPMLTLCMTIDLISRRLGSSCPNGHG